MGQDTGTTRLVPVGTLRTQDTFKRYKSFLWNVYFNKLKYKDKTLFTDDTIFILGCDKITP